MKKIIASKMIIVILLTTTACTYEIEGIGLPLETQDNYYSSDVFLEESENLNKEWGELERFLEDDLFGFKNAQGEIIINAQYRGAHPFSEGLAFVIGAESRECQTGFIDLEGNLVIPLPTAREARRFSGGLAAVRIRDWDLNDDVNRAMGTPPGPFIFIDRTGQDVFGQKFISATHFADGFAGVVLPSGIQIFIDKTGANAFDMEFLNAGDFVDGYANVTLLNRTSTHIDREGNIVDINRIWGQFIWEGDVMIPATYCNPPAWWSQGD